LRTAAAVAQGLALGAGKPVLPVSSLLAVAEEARATRGGDGAFAVWSVLDARMGELYAALHAHDGRAWSTRVEPLLATPASLVARWAGADACHRPLAVAGSGVALLGEHLPDGVDRYPDAAPRARSVLALAAQAWRRGEAVDAALALPLYVRDKVAETEVERRAAKALA
jgi:tRNA threonylcarbamoyladenosine biosynthesis protein TsaB